MEVFRALALYLGIHVQAPQRAQRGLTPPPLRTGEEKSAEMGPLVDMATNAKTLPTDLRVEAAAGLLYAAVSASALGTLGNALVTGALEHLLQASERDVRDEVWYPAATALCHLSCWTTPCFLQGTRALLMQRLCASFC